MQTAPEQKFNFWYRWLFIGSIAFIVFGLVLSLLNNTFIFSKFHSFVDPVFWGNQPISDQGLVFRGWIYGVAGATMASWGVLLAYLTYYPFRRKEKWAWNGLMLGMLAWYVPDTLVSLYFGVWFNIIFSTVVVGLFVLPLIMVRRYFVGLSRIIELSSAD